MKNLITALIKAQSEFQPIKKMQENPFFHSKYADLESVIEGTKTALLSNGLAIIQTFGVVDGKSVLTTTLYHTSGESISGSQLIDVNSVDPQKLASASTYARRYGYLAILGISPAGEDDDGNQAAKPAPRAETKTAAKPYEKIPKINLDAECIAIVRNDKKGRTEYEVTTQEGRHFIIFVKKPQIALQVGQIAQFIGFWETEFKGKMYYFADDIKALSPQTEIEF